MHIPYYGEDSPCESQPKKQTKSSKFIALVAAAALAIVGHPAQAQDRYDFVPAKASLYGIETVSVKYPSRELLRDIEEVVVTARDIRELVIPKVEIFSVRMGLSNKTLIHVYDEKSKTWKYVGTDINDVIADKNS